MDNQKLALYAISCAFFTSVLYLLAHCFAYEDIPHLLQISQGFLYPLLYLCGLVGTGIMVKNIRMVSGRWYYSLPLGIVTGLLFLISLFFEIFALTHMHWTDRILVYGLFVISELLLTPCAALFILALAPCIKRAVLPFLVIISWFSLVSILAILRYLSTQLNGMGIDYTLNHFAHMGIAVTGIIFLIIAGDFATPSMD